MRRNHKKFGYTNRLNILTMVDLYCNNDTEFKFEKYYDVPYMNDSDWCYQHKIKNHLMRGKNRNIEKLIAPFNSEEEKHIDNKFQKRLVIELCCYALNLKIMNNDKRNVEAFIENIIFKYFNKAAWIYGVQVYFPEFLKYVRLSFLQKHFKRDELLEIEIKENATRTTFVENLFHAHCYYFSTQNKLDILDKISEIELNDYEIKIVLNNKTFKIGSDYYFCSINNKEVEEKIIKKLKYNNITVLVKVCKLAGKEYVYGNNFYTVIKNHKNILGGFYHLIKYYYENNIVNSPVLDINDIIKYFGKNESNYLKFKNSLSENEYNEVLTFLIKLIVKKANSCWNQEANKSLKATFNKNSKGLIIDIMSSMDTNAEHYNGFIKAINNLIGCNILKYLNDNSVFELLKTETEKMIKYNNIEGFLGHNIIIDAFIHNKNKESLVTFFKENSQIFSKISSMLMEYCQKGEISCKKSIIIIEMIDAFGGREEFKLFAEQGDIINALDFI